MRVVPAALTCFYLNLNREGYSMKYFVYNTSVSHEGLLFVPGDEIDVSTINPKNLRSMRASGAIISEKQKRALEEAERLQHAFKDELMALSSDEDGFLEDVKVRAKQRNDLHRELEQMKQVRPTGEAPEETLEDRVPEASGSDEPVFEDDEDEDDYDDEESYEE